MGLENESLHLLKSGHHRRYVFVQAPGELSVAPQGASAELAGLTGVWAAVKCLVSIGSKHVDLIKAHAR